MTKAKKAIGVILAVVMLATMFAFGSLAAAAGNATFTVTPSATQVEVGDTVTVTVKVTTDYYAGPIGVPVHYDANLFDYVEGSFAPNADIYGAGAADTNAFNNNGVLTVAFSPLSQIAGARAQVLNDVTLFTFQLTAKANGVSPVELKAEDQKTADNMVGKLYCGGKANSSITSADTMIGQTFTLNNSSVTIGSVVTEPNTLIVKDSFENADSVIIDKYAPAFFGLNDDITGVVYGVETLGYSNGFESFYALADALTTSLGDNYLQVTILTNEEGYETTGTLIEVLDADGSTVLETYYFVYFGDVNGDGYIDNIDATSVKTYALDETALANIYEVLAGDANGDTYTDNVDATVIATATLDDSGYPVQEELAVIFWETLSPDYGI